MDTADSLRRLFRGFDRVARVIAPTLGPAGMAVLHGSPGSRTEHLTDAGTIVRRVTELPDRVESMGAMLLRNLVLTMHERYGDGGATAAVIAQAMLAEAIRATTAGAHPTLVRTGIDRATDAAICTLNAQARPVGGQDQLTRMATGVTGDPDLGAVLGEMFDLLGEHAAFHIEETVVPGIDREYLDGGRWRARPAARRLMPDDGADLALAHPLVLVAEDAATTAAHLLPVLEAAKSVPGSPPLLLVTGDNIDNEALTTLILNHTQGTLAIGAMVLAASRPAIPDDLHDLALMTGATIVGSGRGESWHRVGAGHFGRARSATLTRTHMVVTGGAGDPARIRETLGEIRARATQPTLTHEDRERLARRMARLSGGVGILKVGGRTERERQTRKDRAERASRVFALALAGGVVPGGGSAYLACVDAARSAADPAREMDEAAGAAAVAHALEAPFLQIVRNRGLVHPPLALARVRALGPDHGYDAISGEIVPLVEAGMVDCLGVTRGALEVAASAVGTAITTGAVVLGPRSPQPPARRPR